VASDLYGSESDLVQHLDWVDCRQHGAKRGYFMQVICDVHFALQYVQSVADSWQEVLGSLSNRVVSAQDGTLHGMRPHRHGQVKVHCSMFF
jgi:hypothetical protein